MRAHISLAGQRSKFAILEGGSNFFFCRLSVSRSRGISDLCRAQEKLEQVSSSFNLPHPFIMVSPFAVAMSSTSQKHRDFVGEPMGDKEVTELAGIGDVLGGRLSEKGYDKAYVVLGQFLVLKKNEELFKDWLNQTCSANKKQQADCYRCLKEWCDAFL